MTKSALPDRIRRAVDLLDVQPGDRLLEIGCGPGLTVAHICQTSTFKSLRAIDRSALMIDRARKNNPGVAHRRASTGKVAFEVASLGDLPLGRHTFDKIFAINVNLFWLNCDSELEIVTSLLAPSGHLYLFYEPPSAAQVPQIVAKVRANVERGGLRVEKINRTEETSAPFVGMIAATVLS